MIRNIPSFRRSLRPSLAAVLFLIALMLLLSCTPEGGDSDALQVQDPGSAADQSTAEEAPAVETATIEKGRLRNTIYASGIIQGVEEVILRPVTPGIITDVNVELGRDVQAGEMLLQLDDRIARLNFRQLEREYESAAADLESQRSLYERGSISQTAYNQVQARVDGLAARLEQAEDALDNTRISSPINGKIAQKGTGLIPGDRITAGQQLARVVNLDRLKVELSMGQDQIFLIQEGQPAGIRISSPRGQILGDGFVTAVAAGSDLQTGSWKVIVEFENPEPSVLKAGMSAGVEIESNLELLQPIVPVAALVREEEDWIFLLQEGRAVKQGVEVLDQYGSMAAVRSTADEVQLPGRRVLVSGLSNLNDGDAVRADDRIARLD